MYAERDSRKAAAKRRLLSSRSSGNFSDIALKTHSININREYTTYISPSCPRSFDRAIKKEWPL